MAKKRSKKSKVKPTKESDNKPTKIFNAPKKVSEVLITVVDTDISNEYVKIHNVKISESGTLFGSIDLNIQLDNGKVYSGTVEFELDCEEDYLEEEEYEANND